MTSKPKPMIVREFPDDLRARMKIRAIKEETSLQALIAKACAEYLKKMKKED